jgi:PII-like signaling protein
MKTEANAKLVMIYVNSTDQYHGRPLYQAIIQLCQQQGIAGASVMRCVEGYGAHHRLHTTRLLELSENLPVRIEIVDLKEKIDSFLEPLSKMIDEGLVTISDVHILRFSPEKKSS